MTARLRARNPVVVSAAAIVVAIVAIIVLAAAAGVSLSRIFDHVRLA